MQGVFLGFDFRLFTYPAAPVRNPQGPGPFCCPGSCPHEPELLRKQSQQRQHFCFRIRFFQDDREPPYFSRR